MEYMTEYTITVLKDLIDVSRDECLLFKTAAQNIKDENLREVFTKYAQEKDEDIIKLKAEIFRLGGNPEDITDREIRLPAENSYTDQKLLLHECARKDTITVKRYYSAVREDILWEVIPVVAKQFDENKSIHEQIKDLLNKQLSVQQSSPSLT